MTPGDEITITERAEGEESVVSGQLLHSREELARTVRKIISHEAQRNEARVALIRVVAYSLVLVIDVLMYLGGVRELGNVVMPAVLISLACLIVYAVERWYRSWFGFAIPMIDAIFILEMISSRIDRMGATPSLVATGAIACGLFAATGSIRFDRRVAAWTTFLAVVMLWIIVGIRARAEPTGMLYAFAGLGALTMLNVWLADMTRKAIEARAGRMLLGRFVQQEVVDLAFSDPEMLLAKPRQVVATILVSDLRGFTALAERMKPSQVLSLLNEVQTAFAACVKRNGGRVDKFMGDGMLAVFGAPDAIADHARRAVATAADLRAALAAINARHPDSEPLRAGFGVHSGPVIAGILGAGDRMEFTVIGDTVNTAARLEAMTKEHAVDVLISGATAAQAGAADLRRLGEAPVRGRSAGIHLYTLP